MWLPSWAAKLGAFPSSQAACLVSAAPDREKSQQAAKKCKSPEDTVSLAADQQEALPGQEVLSFHHCWVDRMWCWVWALAEEKKLGVWRMGMVGWGTGAVQILGQSGCFQGTQATPVGLKPGSEEESVKKSWKADAVGWVVSLQKKCPSPGKCALIWK
jgi:hypothetical protein